jgi:hypothetical protein
MTCVCRLFDLLCLLVYVQFFDCIKVFSFFTEELDIMMSFFLPNLCPDSIVCCANLEFCGLYLNDCKCSLYLFSKLVRFAQCIFFHNQRNLIGRFHSVQICLCL